jgi:hypothetical protein
VLLVDTNVLLDVLQDDPEWADWSQQQLEMTSLRGQLCINPVIYAELSIAFQRIEELEKVLLEGDIRLLDTIPREALFLAGKAFLGYRQRRGGTKSSVLPDFFIGAHAAVMAMPLLTRDARHYRAYFPTLRLISPA